MPRNSAVRTTALTAAFIPPASPPLVSTAMLEGGLAVSLMESSEVSVPVAASNGRVRGLIHRAGRSAQ